MNEALSEWVNEFLPWQHSPHSDGGWWAQLLLEAPMLPVALRLCLFWAVGQSSQWSS